MRFFPLSLLKRFKGKSNGEESTNPFTHPIRMADIIVNASTSLVNINSSNISPGFNQVVLLSSVNAPGAIVTVRDYAGYLSTNRKIIISTTTGIQFLQDSSLSSFELITPFSFFTVTPRDTSTWAVLNSFAFGNEPFANVSSLAATTIFSSNIFNLETMSSATMNTSTIFVPGTVSSARIVTSTINASTILAPSSFFSNMSTNLAQATQANMSSIIVTGQTSTATINTSSLTIQGTSIQNSFTLSSLAVSSIVPIATGRPVNVVAMLRPSTIGINLTTATAPLDILGSNIAYSAVTESGNCLQLCTGKSTDDQILVMGNSSNLSTSYIQAIRINRFGAPLILNPRGGNVLMGTATEGGNVGIRTTTPAYPLDVNGNVRFGGGIIGKSGIIGSSDWGLNIISTNTTSQGIIWGYANSLNNAADFHYWYSSSGSTANRISMGFYDNGDIMNILASGRVGIGTTSPTTLLELVSTIPFASRNSNPFPSQFVIRAETHRTHIGSYYTLGVGSATAIQATDFNVPATLLLNPLGGSVIVGSTTSLGLQVNGSSINYTNNEFAAHNLKLIAGDQQLTFGNFSSSTGYHSYIQATKQAVASAPLHINPNGAGNVLLIAGGGANVGIGTSSPEGALDIIGANLPYTVNETQGNAFAIATSKNTAASVLYMGNYSTVGANYSYIQSVSRGLGTTSLILNGRGGAVGIGTGSPSYTLDVNGSFRCMDTVVAKNGTTNSGWAFNCITSGITSQALIFGYGNSTNDSANVSYTYSSSGSGANRLNLGLYNNDNIMNLTGNGYVGIGTTSPSYPLHITRTVNQFVGPYGYLVVGGASGNYPGTNLNISIYTSGVQVGLEQIAISDEREKENIHSYSNALHIVEKLHPVTYTWKDSLAKGKNTNYGFVAQEIHELFPELITKTVDYIPNIYVHSQQSTINQSTLLFFTSTLQTNISTIQTPSKIRLFDEKGNQEENSVLSLTSTYAHISSPLTLSTPYTFVYGTEVNDHMALNYNGVFTITTAALKELHTKVNEQSTIIQILLTQLSTQQSELQDIKCMLKKS